MLRTDDYFDLIGSLVKNGRWTKVLPLAEEQAEAISKLDDLISDAFVLSAHADADYLEGNPADYQEYLAHSDARASETIQHARRMVSLGLLTEPQAVFVIQQHLSSQRQLYSLYEEDVQELLGMTKSQKKKLEQVEEKAVRRETRLPAMLMSPNPEVREKGAEKQDAISQEVDAAAEEILTPEQREKWDQLTAERTLPAEPPDLPTLTETEAGRIQIEEMSPTFRALAENANALKLSDEQKRLLKGLKEVTQLGLFWISHRDGEASFPPGISESGQADPIVETRNEFLKHAEQVALLGILTPQQAKDVEEAVQEN